MKTIYFNFYHVQVAVSSNWDELLDYLRKDFCFFLKDRPSKDQIEIELLKEKPDFKILPEKKRNFQKSNCILYDTERLRYIDYYNEAIATFDLKYKKYKLFSEDLNRAHEISYLAILSLVGKKLDLLGMHKLHAFAVSYDDVVLICMMPSKGGKSTLLLELLKEPRFKLVSDDIPLIYKDGRVLPFPIKLGLNSPVHPFENGNHEEFLYKVDRVDHGEKWFLSTESIKEKLVDGNKRFHKIILIEGFRFGGLDSQIKESHFLSSFLGVFKHGVVGIGTPMVLELFWLPGIKDFFYRIIITCKRLIAFSLLVFRSKKYTFYLGRDQASAAKLLTNLLLRKGHK